MPSKKVKVRFPDGSVTEFPSGTTPLEVAAKIGPKLAKDALAARVDGKLVDLDRKLEGNCAIEILTFDSKDGKAVFWHSAAHVLAQAVLDMFPGTGLGVGPAIEDGFYYDFDKKDPFTPGDLEKIEKRVAEIVKADMSFKRIEMTRAKAKELLDRDGKKNRFRLEILKGLKETAVSFYESGPFVDLCAGPHVPSTGFLKNFKLTKVSGAYWRGLESNPMLQRIYGVSFPEKKMLDDYVKMLEEADKRDHRRIGNELDLFSVQDLAGAGLVFYHPNGAMVRMLIEDHLRAEHLARGYQPVYIPHLFKVDTWKTSGHYDYYKDNMYFTSIEGTEYGIKPMNCPGHILIYKSRSHSYKELPYRLFEFGTVYRHELSGVLTGLFRVRGFTQDDAHVFCTPVQLKDEIKRALQFALELLKTYGFTEHQLTLSTRPDKAIGTPEQWEKATQALKDSLSELRLKYEVEAGGGAFYGPKIDLKIKDAMGRLWQCTTIQVDFNLPERFDVNYVGVDGKKHRVVMIHRALLGSLERFLGILIEHYAGAFPLWLSPVQVEILPVSDAHLSFAEQLRSRIAEAGIRVEVDSSQEKLGAKVRNAQLRKIPLMLVVGEKEVKSGKLVVRRRDGRLEEGLTVEEFTARTRKDNDEKK